jgi:hydrogenase-4 component B
MKMPFLPASLLLVVLVSCVAGVVLALVRQGRYGARAMAWLGAPVSVGIFALGARGLLGGSEPEAVLWMIGGLGPLAVRVDPLSAIFLCMTGLVYFSCSLYAPGHLSSRLDCSAGHYAALHFALMASAVLILTASNAVTLLVSWEAMTILSYLLVNGGEEARADPGAGYLMLVMSEAGFLAVALAFLVAGRGTGDLSFAALRTATAQLSTGSVWAVFILGFFGFGVKAGLVPLNVWLPRAYRAAPSAFVPVLAGVTLNLGLYGIFRLTGDLLAGSDAGVGMFALVVGSVTALLGILYATIENDVKEMLAHSSIENAGIVVAGFGAFLVFRASGHAVAAALALTAALYHAINHSAYKTLLFEGAGDIEAATGTRDLDRLGGLARELPVLSAAFLVGCLAIAAIPPFNGFVSEWLTLQAFLRSAVLASPLVKVVFALAGAALAMTAALAVTCFVKAYAMGFLGISRRLPAKEPARRAAGFPLAFLAAACLLLGVLPTYVIPALDRAVAPMAGASATASLVQPFFTATEANGQLPAPFLRDFHDLGAQTGAGVLPGRGLVLLLRGGAENPVVFAMSPSYAVAAMALLLGVVWLVVRRLTRRRSAVRREVWAGGMPSLLPEMTYTATGFSNPVRVVFQAIFRPNVVEDTRETVAVHFRTAIRRRRDETHVLDRTFFHPVAASTNFIARTLAGMHHGRLNAYVAYVLAFLIFVLLLYRLA